MPPASSTTQEPKNVPAYKIRTMTGDIEALKKGSVPLHSEITINPTSTPQNSNAIKIKPAFPKIEPLKQEEKPPLKPPALEPRKLEINEEIPKQSVPIQKIENQFSKPLVSPPPISPRTPQPFENPIKKPIMPPENLNQQRVQAPPPGLPMESTPPRPTTAPIPPQRPFTPPPTLQQAPKLPPLPPLPTSRPNLPPLPPIPSKQGMPPKKGGGKLVLIGIVSFLIISFVVGEIWWFFLRQNPVPNQATTQDILPPPQELQPLLPVEENNTTNTTETTQTPTEPVNPGLLSYASGTQIIDAANLTKINSDLIGEDTFVKLIIQKNITDTTTGISSPTEVTTLDDLIKLLKINIPTSVKKEFSGEFDVFAFGGNTFDKAECARIKNNSTSCYGPRLGIAIKVLNPIKIASSLRVWEKTMTTDLKPMILTKVGTASSVAFQAGIYENRTIHYKNLPINTVTVEYVLVNDVLVITTSKSAMLKAIDSAATTNP